MELIHSGKVRDVYADGDDLILVASDRVSVYDVVLPTPIPDKGAVLTRLSLWWFEQLADIVPQPRHLRHRRAARVGRTGDPVPAAGHGQGRVRRSGVPHRQRPRGVPADRRGVRRAPARGPGRVGSPARADLHPDHQGAPGRARRRHDVRRRGRAGGRGRRQALRETTLEIYRRGAELARERGIIIADTKVELGRDRDGRFVLADEVLTPDSSRFWDAATWEPGRTQDSFDKQIVRDWAAGTGWDKTAPGPAVPDDIVAKTRARYIEVYERITGESW